jgi:hypothetical protein
MCYMVYLASDTPLRTIPWRKDQPGFNVLPLLDQWDNERAARALLTKPHGYNVGSYQGCGCGFFDRSDQGFECLRQLQRYLTDATAGSRVVELLSFGTGAFELELERKEITPDALLDPEFILEDAVLFMVLPSDDGGPRTASSPHLKKES